MFCTDLPGGQNTYTWPGPNGLRHDNDAVD